MANVNVMGISGITAPFMAVKENGYFQVGDEVEIGDINSLSYMNRGNLIGLIHRGEEKVPMALVQTLEGAPPVRILMTKLNRLKPVKFWMMCSSVDGDFIRISQDHEDFRTTYREGKLAPAKKFATYKEAEEAAQQYSSRFGIATLILETTSFVSSDTQTTSKL